MAVEQLYAHYDHPRTAILMGHARGVILLAAAAARHAGRQLQRHADQEDHHRQRPGEQGAGATHHRGEFGCQPRSRRGDACGGLCHYHLRSRRSRAATIAAKSRPAASDTRYYLRPKHNGQLSRYLYTNQMITKITGTLNRVLDEEVRLRSAPWNIRCWSPSSSAAACRTASAHEVTLHTTHYFDGNPMQGAMCPALIGFLAEAELEFFDLFCTVDKVGIRKAIKALVRPISEIADAIQRQDAKWLTTLPGIGAATAEKIVATLNAR